MKDRNLFQVLGIYTFTKRCILEEFENKQRKTLVRYCIVLILIIILKMRETGKSLAQSIVLCTN